MDFQLDLSYIDILQNLLNGSNIFQLIIKGIFLYIALFWLALIIWVTRDVINRSNNIFFQSFVIILNTFFPVFGLVIYLLIRPQKSLMDTYYEELEYKALSSEKFCPQCSVVVNESFSYCPECGEHLKEACHSCQKEYFSWYKVCPFCGTNKSKDFPKKKQKIEAKENEKEEEPLSEKKNKKVKEPSEKQVNV